MSVYEIFSSKQPHESSNLDAKLRKFLQRFIPAHLKDKPKEYVQKGKSIHSIRRIMRRYPNKEKIKQRLKEELMRGYRKRGRPPRQRRWTSVRRDEYLQEARDELRKELREELKNKSDKQTTQSTSNKSDNQTTQSTSNDSPPQQKKKKQTKIVTPPPSPKTTEHNQPAVSPEEIEKAFEIEEEEEEEEEEDTEREIIEKMKELAKKRKFGKRAKNAEQLRHDDEIDAAREYLRGFPSLRRERKELNDYLLSEMAEDQIEEMKEGEEDPEEYLLRNMFIADDYD